MNTYALGQYNTRTGHDFVKRVQASSAAQAIAQELKRGFTYTCKDQNDANPAKRDNAHTQFDSNGYRGIWAERIEVQP